MTGRFTELEDEQYREAVDLVIGSGKTSTSWLQRKMRLGYNVTARLVERMEAEGVVSSPDHVGRREVMPEALGVRIALREPTSLEAAAVRLGIDDRLALQARIAAEAHAAEMAVVTAREAHVAEAEASGATKARREGRIDGASQEALDQITERAMLLFARREAINADIRDLFAFAKDIGFDKAALRAAINDLREFEDFRKAKEAQREIYRAALGVEGPDFVAILVPPAAPVPIEAKRITAKERQFRDTLAIVAASRMADAQ